MIFKLWVRTREDHWVLDLKGLETSNRNTIMGAIGSGTVAIGWITLFKHSHQNLIILRLICNIPAWNLTVGMDWDVSQQPCQLLISCVVSPRMWTFSSAEYLHITMDSFKLADETTWYPIQLWSNVVLQQGTFTVKRSSLPSLFPFLLFHSFPFSLRLTRFYL